MKTVVIAGGGISGLAASHYLRGAGIASTIVDPGPALGGVIRTSYLHDCVLEAGPDSFLAAKPAASKLIQELGRDNEVIGSNEHLRKTWIVKNGRLVAMPDGLMMMIPTKFFPIIKSPLLSTRAKLRMGLETFRRPSGTTLPDRSVKEFLDDHYGSEALDYLAEPLLAGVYGGDPAQMSARSVLGRFVDLEEKYGSLSRGALAERKKAPAGSLFRTLRGGLGTLVEPLANSAEWLQAKLEAVRFEGGRWRARVNERWFETEHLILALPAPVTAELLRDAAPRASALLKRINYSSCTTLNLVFRRADVQRDLRGFGFLVPSKERQTISACTFVQNKFAGRAPDDVALLRCFIPHDGHGESDEKLVELACADLRKFLGLQAQPVFHSVARWPKSMPQYPVGHADEMLQLTALFQEQPGLSLIGNAYAGVGIPDCIALARATASKIATEIGNFQSQARGTA